MFISPAYAQSAGGGGFDLVALAPLVLIFVVFYFLLIRPQQKRMKEHKAMLAKIHRNDRIVTNGGLIGKVARVHDERDELEVDNRRERAGHRAPRDGLRGHLEGATP